MGVTQDQQPEIRLGRETRLRPLALGLGGPPEGGFIPGLLMEVGTEAVHQPETQVRWQAPEHRAGHGGTGDPVQPSGDPPLFGEAVTVMGLDDPGANPEPDPIPGKADTTFRLPERIAPSVVVATGHHDRQPAAESSQLPCDPESTSGDGPAIGEPEIEQVAVDEQTVTQIRDHIKKRGQRFFDGRGDRPQVGVAENDQLVAEHGSKYRNLSRGIARKRPPSLDGTGPVSGLRSEPISEITVRVNYSETDRMGVAYHGRYPAWLDMARTEHLRRTGVSYRELEDDGLLLAVSDLQVRYRRSAEYDDLVRVRCWVREISSRKVTFGYAVEHAGRGEILATAITALISMDRTFAVVRLPDHLVRRLTVIADPVRL